MDTMATAVADSVKGGGDIGPVSVALGLFYLLGGLALAAVAVLLYFIPAIHAKNVNHKDVSAITIVNLLFGWTCLGWLLAFVWAHTSPGHVIVHAAQPAPPQRTCASCTAINTHAGNHCANCGAKLSPIV